MSFSFLIAFHSHASPTRPQLCKNTDAIDEESKGRLDVKGEFHLGDMVNCIRKGSLVMQNTQSSSASRASSAAEDIVAGIKGELVFGTVSGRIGVIARINGAQYRFLLRLQNAIAQVVPRVGRLSYREWRSLHNERRMMSSASKPLNFIDGDMIERFLDLDRASMEKVSSLVNQSITVAAGVANKAKEQKKGRVAPQSGGASGDVDSKSLDGPSAGTSKSASVSVDALIRIVEDLSRIH